MATYTWEEAAREADSRLSLSQVMAQRGEAPPAFDKKFKCAFCGKKSAVVSRGSGCELFHCWQPGCPSSVQGKNGYLCAHQYLGARLGVAKGDAFWMWLKEAGIQRSDVKSSPRWKPAPPVGSKPCPAPGSEAEAADLNADGEVVDVPVVEDGDLDGEAAVEAEAPAEGAAVTAVVEVTESAPAAPVVPAIDVAKISGRPEVVAPPAAAGAAGAAGATSAEEAVEDEDESVQAKREFWELLPPEDFDRMAGRGLIDDAVLRFGLRRNGRENEVVLRELAKRYTPKVMARAGLYHYPRQNGQEDVTGEPVPNGQFCGYGLANRKTEEWGWTNPTIIPYFDSKGRVVELRPHKGGIKSGWTTYNVAPRLYLATGVGFTLPTHSEVALVTEGEFKAMAVAQVMDLSGTPGDYSVAAMPGIQMTGNHEVQNHYVWDGLLRWLKQVKPRLVVVVFDNEEKGDPRLPGYKPNPRDRHEAQAWALLTAKLLKRQSYQVRVGSLEDECRDANGKADWDGAVVKWVTGK